MARIRSIHPGLATDEAFMLMSAFAKAAWPLLWGECDDQGIFEWKPVVLKARLLPADLIAFEDILEEWVRLGTLMRYEINGRSYGAVRNFVRFQRPKKPKDTHPSTESVRKWVGFLADGSRPSAGTGRNSSSDSSEPVPNSGGTSSEFEAQMKEEGGRMKENPTFNAESVIPKTDDEKIDCRDQAAPSVANLPTEPREIYDDAELKGFIFEFSGMDVETAVRELAYWTNSRGITDPIARKNAIYGGLKKRYARFKLQDALTEPETATASPQLVALLARRDPARRRSA